MWFFRFLDLNQEVKNFTLFFPKETALNLTEIIELRDLFLL